MFKLILINYVKKSPVIDVVNGELILEHRNIKQLRTNPSVNAIIRLNYLEG